MLPRNERMEPTVSLPEIFSNLVKRLIQIQKSQYDITSPFSNLKGHELYYTKVETITRHIYDFPYSKSLDQVLILLSKIQSIEDNFESIFSKIIVHNSFNGQQTKFDDLKEVEKEEIKAKLEEELDYYKKELEDIHTNIEDLITDKPAPGINWNLSLPQLSYLFRSLVEEGIINIGKGRKEEFYRTVAGFSSTKESKDISNSFKNNFLKEADEKTLDFWQEKFTHLMQKTKKDKEIYGG